jgi:hypothetical protein
MCNQTIYAQDDMAALIIVGSLTETEPSPRVKIFGESLPLGSRRRALRRESKKKIFSAKNKTLGEDKKTLGEEFFSESISSTLDEDFF